MNQGTFSLGCTGNNSSSSEKSLVTNMIRSLSDNETKPLIPPTNTTSTSFVQMERHVNAYLAVYPALNTIVFPRQYLSCPRNDHDQEIDSTLCEPFVLTSPFTYSTRGQAQSNTTSSKEDTDAFVADNIKSYFSQRVGFDLLVSESTRSLADHNVSVAQPSVSQRSIFNALRQAISDTDLPNNLMTPPSFVGGGMQHDSNTFDQDSSWTLPASSIFRSEENMAFSDIGRSIRFRDDEQPNRVFDESMVMSAVNNHDTECGGVSGTTPYHSYGALGMNLFSVCNTARGFESSSGKKGFDAFQKGNQKPETVIRNDFQVAGLNVLGAYSLELNISSDSEKSTPSYTLNEFPRRTDGDQRCSDEIVENSFFPSLFAQGSFHDAFDVTSSQVVNSDAVETTKEIEEDGTDEKLKATNNILPALSAYNYFFRDERDRILNGGDMRRTLSKQDELLNAHWTRDRNLKRLHRKSHGKISFKTLSRTVSQRWKGLSEDEKTFYREISARDWSRYHQEMNTSQTLKKPKK